MQWDAARLLALCGLQTPPALFGSACVQSQPLPPSHAPLRVPDCPPSPRALVRAHGTTPTTRDRSPPRRPGLGRTCEVPLTREAAHSLVRGSDMHIFGAVIIQSYPAQCVSCQRAQEQVRYGRIVCTAGARPWPPAPPAAAGTRRPRLCVYRLRLFLAVGSCVLFLRLARKRGGSHGICLPLSRT